ncbi:MAG TPA: abortive infection system antitoxin AbiGi family protein [Flavobacterium sp.]
MAISTNSIIHYTDTLDKLKSILKEGFAIKYCAETLEIEDNKGSQAAHPMISFCDIPLSQSFKHFAAYGRYGIGLSKEWANENGINPVLYLESKSLISKTIGNLLVERRNPNTKLTIAQKSSILHIKSFTKNYSGHLKRNKVNDPNYRYYDEREWRLVPEKKILGTAKFSINLSDYNINKKKYNDMISKLRFEFEPDDISYIIVDKTTEIPNVINLLRLEYASKCTAQKLDILFSKIASTEQIISDY